MTTLIMTLGLPASGKSTWACQQLHTAPPASVVRITKDMLRLMLHDGVHEKGTEAQVLRARDALIRSFLRNGTDVIVDDTNLAEFHERQLRLIAKQMDAEFHIEDFTHVPLEVCIERDARRDASVGRAVIEQMYTAYLAR